MKNTFKLILLLVSLISLWGISVAVKSTMVWFAVINICAIYIICKTKNSNKKDIFIGLLFAVLSIPSNFMMGLWIILPYIASSSIFKKSKNQITLLKFKGRKDVLSTIILVFLVGGLLGGINIFFALGSMEVSTSFNILWIFHGLRAGIVEEIFFRMFFFALCVYIINDANITKIQNIICYLIMVIPHVLIHFNFESINLGSIIMLSLLFGLPFALMQRKNSLVSAIGSHAFVDVIRFCTFGI